MTEHERMFARVYAIPGKAGFVDGINPDTGLSVYGGRTAEQVATAYPGAVPMAYEEWRTQAIAAQKTPITWKEVSADRYDDMLNVLPPLDWRGGAFLVGEAWDHDIETGRPRYAAFRQFGPQYFEASRPLTRAELRTELEHPLTLAAVQS